MNTGQAMPIPPGEFTVGRLEDAYVRVEDPSVSRTHARLYNGWEGLFVEDAGSSNGTAMRGALIKGRTKLNIGDIIYIGSVPYRIDPEVAPGGSQTSALPPLAAIKPGSLTRATERIPAVGEAPRIVEAIAPEKLSAPEVSSADVDAEELNAIQLREPAPVAPRPTPVPTVSASSRPQATGQTLPKMKPHSVRIAVSVPGPQESFNVPRYPEPKPEALAVPVRVAAVANPRVPTPLNPQASLSPLEAQATGGPVVVQTRGPVLPAFMVGLGVGIIVGFIIAWLLIRNLYL